MPRHDGVRLPFGVLARFSIGSIGTGGFGTLPGLVLVYYLTDALGVAALLAGLVVTLAKVWDIIIDPVIGAMTDREHTRTGGRSRLMLLGGLSIPVLFLLTFAVPPGAGPLVSVIWVGMAFIGAATAFSLFQVPYIELPAELTGGYHERTRLLTARVIVLSVAILLFGAGGPALRGLGGDDAHLGYLLMGLVAGVVLGGGFVVASTVGTKRHLGFARSRPIAAEPVRRGLLEHYRAALRVFRESRAFRILVLAFGLQALATGTMLACAQYVATYLLRDEDAVTFLFLAMIAPAIVCTPLWAWVARRVGKRRGFAIATVIFTIAAVAQLGIIWAPGAWVYVAAALAGAAYSGLQALPMAMLPDVIAVDAREGRNRGGAFAGAWTAVETLAMTLGTTLLTIVLASTGYLESTAAVVVEQPPAAVLGIALTFALAPAALAALSLLAIRRYPLRQEDVEAVTTGAPAPEVVA
ncbi:MAG TPA: MFS transporter [Microbacteriaceae bacterium]|nr:MFS transporter [Microbacteriaceae bacterium]